MQEGLEVVFVPQIGEIDQKGSEEPLKDILKERTKGWEKYEML